MRLSTSNRNFVRPSSTISVPAILSCAASCIRCCGRIRMRRRSWRPPLTRIFSRHPRPSHGRSPRTRASRSCAGWGGRHGHRLPGVRQALSGAGGAEDDREDESRRRCCASRTSSARWPTSSTRTWCASSSCSATTTNWFFTMEFVDGVSFLRVRAAGRSRRGGLDAGRLRAALPAAGRGGGDGSRGRQAALRPEALERAGVAADDRVVVLDFGLVTEIEAPICAAGGRAPSPARSPSCRRSRRAARALTEAERLVQRRRDALSGADRAAAGSRRPDLADVARRGSRRSMPPSPQSSSMPLLPGRS